MGYSPWGCKKSDKTEWLTHTHDRKISDQDGNRKSIGEDVDLLIERQQDGTAPGIYITFKVDIILWIYSLGFLFVIDGFEPVPVGHKIRS